MKTNVKQNKSMVIILSAVAIVVVILVVFFAFFFNKGNDTAKPLSAEQISKLKATYAVNTGIPELANGKNIPFDDVAKKSDSFVYGTVVSEKLYKNYGELDGLDEDEKEFLKKIGESTMQEYYCYLIRVEKDSEGVFKKDDLVLIGLSDTLDRVYPVLEKSSKVVVPVSKFNEQLYNYVLEGMYYVTEDSHIISYYKDEDKDTTHPANCKSGITVDEFLKNVKEFKAKQN